MKGSLKCETVVSKFFSSISIPSIIRSETIFKKIGKVYTDESRVNTTSLISVEIDASTPAEISAKISGYSIQCFYDNVQTKIVPHAILQEMQSLLVSCLILLQNKETFQNVFRYVFDGVSYEELSYLFKSLFKLLKMMVNVASGRVSSDYALEPYVHVPKATTVTAREIGIFLFYVKCVSLFLSYIIKHQNVQEFIVCNFSDDWTKIYKKLHSYNLNEVLSCIALD